MWCSRLLFRESVGDGGAVRDPRRGRRFAAGISIGSWERNNLSVSGPSSDDTLSIRNRGGLDPCAPFPELVCESCFFIVKLFVHYIAGDNTEQRLSESSCRGNISREIYARTDRATATRAARTTRRRQTACLPPRGGVPPRRAGCTWMPTGDVKTKLCRHTTMIRRTMMKISLFVMFIII